MKFSKLFWLIALLPLGVTLGLYSNDFSMNTKDFLDITLQLVWGIMFALGGGIVYLSKFQFKENNSQHSFRKIITKHTQQICYPLLIQTLIFVLIAIVYSTRDFSRKALHVNENVYSNASVLIDSLLLSLIIIPALFSIIVGMVCVYLAVHHEDQKP